MLKNPKKNFGILPSGDFVMTVILGILFLLVPVISIIVRSAINVSIPTAQAFYGGFALTMIFLWAFTIKKPEKDAIGYYGISKRERYMRKILIPFLNKKYGVKVHAKTKSDLTRLALKGEVNVTKNDKFLEDVHFMGWEEIESAAVDKAGNPDLGSLVYLVKLQDDESLVELIPEGIKDGESLTVYRPQQNIPSLEETESGVRNMVFDIISAVPESETVIRGVAPSNTEFPGVDSELRVFVDAAGQFNYSGTEMKKLVEDVVFNVRMNQTALVVSLINTPAGKTYVSGRLVANEGYEDVSGKDLKTMAKAEESEHMIFLDDIKKLSNTHA